MGPLVMVCPGQLYFFVELAVMILVLLDCYEDQHLRIRMTVYSKGEYLPHTSVETDSEMLLWVAE